MDFNQVANGVYVGGWSAARDYGQQFDAIINVARDAPNHGTLRQFDLVDGPGNSQTEFNDAVSCVRAAIDEGKRVLVHCVAGRSRSITVAALALSLARGGKFSEVLEACRKARGCEEHQPHSALLELAEAYA